MQLPGQLYEMQLPGSGNCYKTVFSSVQCMKDAMWGSPTVSPHCSYFFQIFRGSGFSRSNVSQCTGNCKI